MTVLINLIVGIVCMRYQKFIVRMDGEEKKLGVLGEVHIYHPQETEFARGIVKNYHTVAYEGGWEPHIVFYSRIYRTIPLVFEFATVRSRKNDTAKTIAMKMGKEVLPMNDRVLGTMSRKQKISYVVNAFTSALGAPIMYYYLRKYGDPLEYGTDSFHLSQEIKPTDGLLGPFLEYATYSNSAEREDNMADTSDFLIKRRPDLLGVVGDEHFDSLIFRLYERLEMERVKSLIMHPYKKGAKIIEQKVQQ